MPNPQMRNPEMKHIISKKPVECSPVIQQKTSNKISQSSVERLEDNAPKNAKRRRGRRKSKGVIMEDLPADVESRTSKKDIVLQRRPGFGQLGTKCVVKANYFLAELSRFDLCQYNVSA